MLSSNLEKTLRDAYQLAIIINMNLLLLNISFCLIDDKDALSVLNACG